MHSRRAVLIGGAAGVLWLLAGARPLDRRPKPKPTPTASASPPVSTQSVAPTVLPSATPILTFQDDFTGTALDASKWVPIWLAGDPGDRADTDQGNYGFTNITVANSIATIHCIRQTTISGRPFAAGTMCTYGLFSQQYGTFEARVRYDECKGSFPSWFLLPVGQKGPYPEIDVFEAHGDAACEGPGTCTTSLSTSSTNNDHLSFIPVASGQFHTHRFVWSASKIEFFIDGVSTYSSTTVVPQAAMYPIFTWGVGDFSNASCRADGTTPDDSHMDIDYIRIWA